MTTWQDVERVKQANPTWGSGKVASELGCSAAYVRATAQPRGWGSYGDGRVTLRVRVDTVKPLCRPDESPYSCLRRIVHHALVRAGAAKKRT